MPRLTIIGTSHVGAFKEGWDAIAPEHPDWDVSFFAMTSPRFRCLRLSSKLTFGLPAKTGKVRPDLRRALWRFNQANSTDLAAADAVLWAGFRRPFDKLAAYLEGYDVEGLTVRGGLPLVTRAEFDAACDQIAEGAIPDESWLGWERPRLALHACPIPAETLLSDESDAFGAWSAFADRPGGQRAAIDAFLARYEAALAAHGIALLRPPEETLLESGLTAAGYGVGSRRLGRTVEHPQSDHRHMNASYGRLALAALFATLGPALAQASAATAGARPAIAGPGEVGRRAGQRGRRRREKRQVGRAPRERDSLRAASPALGDTAAPTALGRRDDAPIRTDPPAASPYRDLPARAYWRSGVAERAALDPGDLYHPHFPVTRQTRVATAGSCFAQHVGRALRGAGFHILDAEPLPASIPEAAAGRFGYRLFSGRYGNIYTARQLAQLLDETEGRVAPALPVWRRGERFFDAQRPGVEPEGLDSVDAVLRHRESHLAGLRGLFRDADLVVFTFGLTEAWIHRETGTVYPTAPGTIAGAYDPAVFAFRNYDAAETLADFEGFRTALQAINPGVRFLVTVSPVPLTATASGDHVEVATCYSKAVLRAVCGMLVARHADVDYFPSFEIITSQSARGAYYEPNLRNVSPVGVQTAMNLFLRAHGVAPEAPGGAEDRKKSRKRPTNKRSPARDDPCEDALLEAFVR